MASRSSAIMLELFRQAQLSAYAEGHSRSDALVLDPNCNAVLDYLRPSFYKHWLAASFLPSDSRVFLHLGGTLSSPPIPPSAGFLPSSYTSELCLVLSKNRGLKIPMLHRSRTTCILSRRPALPDFLSPRFSMVCPRYPHLSTRVYVLTQFVRFIPGILIILFFKCMTTLLNPAHHRGEHVKWGIVSYTVAMFSLATVQTAMLFHIESISYIDNREFSGLGDVIPPGPYGYQLFISPEAINIIPSVALTLNNWLADGLLVGSLFNAVLTRPSV